MAVLGRFDGDMEMFIVEPKKISQAHLRYLRWLAERGQLEHEVVSSPAGDYALSLAVLEPAD